jgi:hypothetical protein
METKKKLIEAFENLLRVAKTENLNREKTVIDVCDFKEKCKKRMSNLTQQIIVEVPCESDFGKEPGFSIRIDDDKDKISIFPIKAQYSTDFCDYKSKSRRFTFCVKRKKFKEL